MKNKFRWYLPKNQILLSKYIAGEIGCPSSEKSLYEDWKMQHVPRGPFLEKPRKLFGAEKPFARKWAHISQSCYFIERR